MVAHIPCVKLTIPGPAPEKRLRKQNDTEQSDRAGIAFGTAGECFCAPTNLRLFPVVLWATGLSMSAARGEEQP